MKINTQLMENLAGFAFLLFACFSAYVRDFEMSVGWLILAKVYFISADMEDAAQRGDSNE